MPVCLSPCLCLFVAYLSVCLSARPSVRLSLFRSWTQLSHHRDDVVTAWRWPTARWRLFTDLPLFFPFLPSFVPPILPFPTRAIIIGAVTDSCSARFN